MSRAFQDGKNNTSMGRIISFMGALVGMEIIQVGLFLCVYESVTKGVAVVHGISIVAIGVGIYTSGALFKHLSKGLELKETGSE